ncbi:exodeoxyribonuclease V subunit beta [Vibrio hippocampi]|uniref:RecBCD enzyme subunit RecB n=1 Tax=Vibrio hippocampi TaxID=654686 RepID=A0ABN8DJ13_9VIBR|nr:exodeoxyribonuclease V subunit beta [Vibrio hippocampi]CAH0526741.1 RecBCD enzyme subunit RecB [Vibrio hippocampi]
MSDKPSQQPTPLQTMSFPLHGARLIEASAGTGKTFTIAGLYLRLLLGHGCDNSRHQQPLTVDQILVVTFTEAATAELRDRIRKRIHDARIAFARGSSNDPIIEPLLQQVTDHRFAMQALLQAERQMDEAAVYTIHGFCQRMLTQNAFESGARFNNEFITDESRLKAQVVADFWRSHFYPLPPELAQQVRTIWSTPSALLSDISNYLTGSAINITGAVEPDDLYQLHQEYLVKIGKIKSLWVEAASDVEAVINASGVNKKSYSKRYLPAWITAVTAWSNTETKDYYLPDQLEKFSQQVLADKTSKGEVPELPVFAAIDELLETPPELKNPLMMLAIRECRERLRKVKNAKQWLSFDDLLSHLSAAFDQPSGDLLADKIRSQYPVAMIDEFQDTDPLQYHIFSRIYLDNPECGWFMIGDPKQAIYGFRGADIFTYIQARNQVSDHYTLGTNWRSTDGMVQGVNTLFKQSQSPFLYDDDIPFYPVNSSPKAHLNHWERAGEKQPAIEFWLQQNDKPVAKGEYQQTMAEATAEHIATLLAQGDNQQAQLVESSKGEPRYQDIQASDIAILVRTGNEAKMVKQALASRRVASVYLSNRDSVFASEVARDMLRLLMSVWYQGDERLLKAAIATELFDLSAEQLDQINNDENVWEQWVAEFKQYRAEWQGKGVLPMLRKVLLHRALAIRFLSHTMGERWLTDYLHLAELLQSQRQEVESDSALLRWFGQRVEDAQSGQNGDDSYIQRLESERNLVQIVTIHKSKGLEYNLVYLPFVVSYREAQEAKFYDEQQGLATLDLKKSKAALAQADHERLAEDLRLIYVALTRAVFGCFIGVAPIRNGRQVKEPTGVHCSAIGHLIQNGAELGVDGLAQALGKLAQQHDGIKVTDVPQVSDFHYQAKQSQIPQLEAAKLTRHIDRDWRFTSYSSLVKQGHKSSDEQVFIESAGIDIDSSQEQETLEIIEPEKSIFHFPKGARPGTFLHTIFEEVEFTEPASSEANQQIITDLLIKEQYELEWLPIVTQLVDDVMNTSLDGKELRLKHKDKTQRLVEMEFLLPISLLQAPVLSQVIKAHDPLSQQTEDLGFYPVKGMLKGFIDLVFEHQGKYYVLDWKSNYLGDDESYYLNHQLQHSMVDHRYDLQYQIYALALHRFLRTRLADYRYEQHFGGVYYLFLRGIKPGAQSGIFYTKPSEALVTSLDKLIQGEDGNALHPMDEPTGVND